jgi:hypothetical protein
MDTNKIFESKLFKGIVLGIVGVLILAFVFGLGVFVGTKKADFSFAWADQYHRNFGGPQGGLFGEFMGMNNEFANANGVFGQIIKIDGQTFTIKGKDNVEKSILIGDDATIMFQRTNIKLADLKINDNVVVIGDPTSNGQIQAELIRVVPAPPKSPVKNNLPPGSSDTQPL